MRGILAAAGLIFIATNASAQNPSDPNYGSYVASQLAAQHAAACLLSGGANCAMTGSIGLNGYATFGPTSQPANATADLVAGNDQYHDNVLTLENDSVSNTGQCGNAATRYRDSIIHYERGAFGYSVINTGCHGFYPDTLYGEIGNIGPPADPDDTSFAIVSTHAAAATNFPGTSYKAFEVRGDTGNVFIRDHTGATGLEWFESDHHINTDGVIQAGGFTANSNAGLSVTKTVRASGGVSDCTMTFTGGLLTASTC